MKHHTCEESADRNYELYLSHPAFDGSQCWICYDKMTHAHLWVMYCPFCGEKL